jgi:uncharacterized protein YndB with AHSA1/START domain
MVRLWGRDDRFALKDAAIAAALDRSLHADGPTQEEREAAIEIGVDLPVPAAEAMVWFCDPQRWVRFQGQQAWLDPKPGGRLRLDLGNDVLIRGHYIAVDDHEITFTWGMEGDRALPAESTEVTVTAVPQGDGHCALILRHYGLPDAHQSNLHRSGWRYHLVRLAVAASGATGETELVDLFLAAASEPDKTARRGLLDRVCKDGVEFSDGRSNEFGTNQIAAHFARVVESGQRRTRQGDVERHGGIARCDYVVRNENGVDDRPVGSGQLVAAVDAAHLTAVSFFEAPSEPGRRSLRPGHAVQAVPASGEDPWRDAPPPSPSPKPRHEW